MAVRKLKLTHPGKILREQFMKPIGLSAYALAKALDVPPSRVSHVARARRGISPEMAVLLSVYFGTSDSYWISLQGHYDMEIAKDRLRKHAARIPPHAHKRKRSPKRNPPDSRIDTSDIPPLTDDHFRTAVRNPFYRRAK
jgi:addiction module HigA family antidote